MNEGMRPVELTPANQMLLHLAARVYHTVLLCIGRGPGMPYAYLREQGLTDETILREGIGYATGDLLGPALAISSLTRVAAAELNLLDRKQHHQETMAGRIVFLECDRNGRVLHLIGQRFALWLGDHAPKYLSLNDVPVLHGYARLDKRLSQRPVLVFETPLDALIGRQWGFDTLATTSVRLTGEQARLLAAAPRPLLLVPRNDGGEGRKTVECWQMMIGKGLIMPLPRDMKDLSDFGNRLDGEAQFVAWLKRFGYERRPRKHGDKQKALLGDK